MRVSRKRFKDKPWLTKELKDKIQHNHRLYKKSLPSVSAITTYNTHKNHLRICLHKAEEQFYRNLFEHQKNSAFNLWKLLGRIINPDKKKS